MTRFIALGDSTTAGFGDPDPVTGQWRGWAALLATGLAAPVEFHNLSTSGARAAEVAARQLPAALAYRPDLAAVLVGVNDTLRGDFDVPGIGTALDHTIGQLRSAGAAVLTGCLPDPGRMFRLPAALARPLGRRVCAINAVVHRVADRHQTVHLHIPRLEPVYDRSMWSVDRLHPGERGHRFLAGAYHDLLGGAGFPIGSRPAPEPTSPAPSVWAQTGWMLTKGTKWLALRSTDLLPYLLRMMAAEWWHGLRGAVQRLDAHLPHELARSIDQLADPEPADPRA